MAQNSKKKKGTERSHPSGETSASGRRILLVDDDPMVCETVKMMLASEGHHVEMANSGKDALASFNRKDFDVVITDFAMPEMNGHEMAAIMKAHKPGQPIIMITAYADVLLASKPLPSVDLIVNKPILLDALQEAITRVLAGNGNRKPNS